MLIVPLSMQIIFIIFKCSPGSNCIDWKEDIVATFYPKPSFPSIHHQSSPFDGPSFPSDDIISEWPYLYANHIFKSSNVPKVQIVLIEEEKEKNLPVFLC